MGRIRGPHEAGFVGWMSAKDPDGLSGRTSSSQHDAGNREAQYLPRSARPECGRTGLQGRPSSRHVVHEHDWLSGEARALPMEGIIHVRVPPQPVQANLRGRVPEPVQAAARPVQAEPPPQLGSQQLSLVVAACAAPLWMERHRDEHGSRRYVGCQVGHAEARQRGRQGPPALVLEAVDRFLERSIVSGRRPNTP